MAQQRGSGNQAGLPSDLLQMPALTVIGRNSSFSTFPLFGHICWLGVQHCSLTRQRPCSCPSVQNKMKSPFFSFPSNKTSGRIDKCHGNSLQEASTTTSLVLAKWHDLRGHTETLPSWSPPHPAPHPLWGLYLPSSSTLSSAHGFPFSYILLLHSPHSPWGIQVLFSLKGNRGCVVNITNCQRRRFYF